MLENNKYCNSAAHKHHLQEDRLFKPALSIVFILALTLVSDPRGTGQQNSTVRRREGGGGAGVLFISL